MTKDLRISLNSFFWLIYRGIRSLKKTIVTQWIDFAILTGSITLIYGYIMPSLGLKGDYGIFMMLGQVAACCVWIIQGESTKIVTDLDGPKVISYELTLPLPYWAVYIKVACEYAIKAALVNIINIPLGLFLLWNKVDWSQISIFKFLLIYPLINIFFAFFCLFIAVYVKGIVKFSSFWMRWGAQLFFFSGYFFSWYTLYGISKLAAHINLINPLIYPFEAIHIPFMGQSGFINFWLCVPAIILFTLLFALIGIRIFKRRLDCV